MDGVIAAETRVSSGQWLVKGEGPHQEVGGGQHSWCLGLPPEALSSCSVASTWKAAESSWEKNYFHSFPEEAVLNRKIP